MSNGGALIDFLSTFALTGDSSASASATKAAAKAQQHEPSKTSSSSAGTPASSAAKPPLPQQSATPSTPQTVERAAAAPQRQPLRYAVFLTILRTDPVLSRAVKRVLASVSDALAEERTALRSHGGTHSSSSSHGARRGSTSGAAEPGDAATAAMRVQAFLQQAFAHVAASELWRDALDDDDRSSETAAMSEEATIDVVDHLEKLLMQRLYADAFPRLDPILGEQDAELTRRICALASFVTASHLDVPAELESAQSRAWAAAATQLARVDEYRAPRDKMVCVVNACNVINGALGSAGADEFIPALIYVLLRANPARLHSNLSYIARFRRSGGLTLRPGYYLTALRSAVTFVTTLTHRELTGIGAAEFDVALDRGVELARRGVILPVSAAAATAAAAGGTSVDANSCALMSTAQLEDELNVSLLLPSEGAGIDVTRWSAARYRFVERSAEELRVAELPQLLHEYKMLAAATELLLTERAVAVATTNVGES